MRPLTPKRPFNPASSSAPIPREGDGVRFLDRFRKVAPACTCTCQLCEEEQVQREAEVAEATRRMTSSADELIRIMGEVRDGVIELYRSGRLR